MNLREELLAIREQHGLLTPRLVVETARDPNHPLHPKFEWDDSIAGESYRRQQAAELIRSVKVAYLPPGDGPKTDVRAFHAIKDPVRGHVYDPVNEIVEDPVARQLLLRDMERDWRALKARWERFAEFVDLVLGDLSKTA